MEVLEVVLVVGFEYLVVWMKVVVYGVVECWIDVIDQVKSVGKWLDKFLVGVVGVVYGVVVVNLVLFIEVEC